tara:strand:- start:175 stop:1734 length:1560 start_codon:yes stop_codon:yes gene_type:complete
MNFVLFSRLSFPVHQQLELAFIDHLKASGHTVRAIICDISNVSSSALDDCEVIDHYTREKNIFSLAAKRMACRESNTQNLNILEKSGIDTVFVTEILNEKEILDLSKRLYLKWNERYTFFSEIGNLRKDEVLLMERRILSSLFTRTRTSEIKELTEIFSIEQINEKLDSALAHFMYGYYVAKIVYKKIAFDSAILFNGRFNPFSGIKTYLYNHNLKCIIHERGYKSGSFQVSIGVDPGNPFYSFDSWAKEYQQGQGSLSEEQRKEIKEFILQRSSGETSNGFSYSGSKSVEINKGVRLISYFTSCSDEISSYGVESTYDIQIKQIEHIAKITERIPAEELNLIIRCHPNLGLVGRHTKAGGFLRDLIKLSIKHKKIKVIEPEVKIYPIEIADNSIINIAPQSTLNIDLSFLRCNMIYVKDSPYYNVFKNYSIDLYSLKDYSSLKNSTVNKLDNNYIEYIAYNFYLATSLKFKYASIKDGFYPNYMRGSSPQDCKASLAILKMIGKQQNGLVRKFNQANN